MKVLLICPKVTRLFEEAPLGIMYIAAVLREAGHDVELIDGDIDSVKGQTTIACNFRTPDIIGFSCTTLNYPLVMEMVRYIGKWNPEIPIVVGGVHATIMPETILSNPLVDCCTIGEAENTIVDLCRYIEGRGAISEYDINGLAFIDIHGNLHYTNTREPIANLDSIPFPARDLLDPIYFKNKRTTLIASRGCPYNCSYCQPTLRKMFGNKVRRRSVQNVVAEMLEMYYKQNIRYFKFFDDTFTADKKWVVYLCNLIFETFHETNRPVKLDCLTRVSDVDGETLRVMKRAGFCIINFGVESGCQKTLNYYRKGTKVEQAVRAFKLCREAKIKAHSCLMIGAPNETMEDINETKELIKKMKPDSMCVSITTPMPHTALWDDCIKNGLIKEGDWLKVGDYLQKWGGISRNLSEEELFKLKQSMMRGFWIKKALNPATIYRFMLHHDIDSFLRDAKYFLWKGDYS